MSSQHNPNDEFFSDQLNGGEFDGHEYRYEDSFDEYDYHEAGVEEGLSFLEFAGIAALFGAFSSNRRYTEEEQQASSSMFWFLLFFPITFPLLVMALMVMIPFKIAKFILKLFFSGLSKAVIAMRKPDTPIKNTVSKSVTRRNQATNAFNNKIPNQSISKDIANNYVVKNAATQNKVTKKNVASNKAMPKNESRAKASTDIDESIKSIDKQIEKLEQQKEALKQTREHNVKAKNLAEANRVQYYKNTESNMKQNATDLAAKATIKYI
ncbi:hypothetical protein [Thalassotalea crassostreae]|uniref:hypothetical protein n=1 Tax=Thalassotalea crassostreae TaxID=1763536 RepID=UPI000838FE30|nr:hypothetical protein [Thalassotalea crassostreae]